MPRDYAALDPAAARRRDRAVTDEAWIRTFLHAAPYGALATVHDGRPFLNSNLFVYDEARHALYLHTAHVGRTAAKVEAGGEGGVPVCLSAFTMGRLLPADTALEFSVNSCPSARIGVSCAGGCWITRFRPGRPALYGALSAAPRRDLLHPCCTPRPERAPGRWAAPPSS